MVIPNPNPNALRTYWLTFEFLNDGVLEVSYDLVCLPLSLHSLVKSAL